MPDRCPLIHPFLHQENQNRRRRWLAVFLLIIIFLFLGAGFWFWRQKKNPSPSAEFNLANLWQTTKNLKETISLAPSLLGYGRPKTYLILFLNDTEIRPGGGFIGSYALTKFKDGKLLAFETSGSEILDWQAPEDFRIEAPTPIKDYLHQPRWYFRDANWSPDFPESARQTLWFYRFEGGKDGSKIDGVIGLTTQVVKEIIKIAGPVQAGEKVFNAENLIEELQYHVEFGYKEEGKTREERKAMIGDLGQALLARLSILSPLKWQEIYILSQRMFKEKQMMIYSTDEKLQEALVQLGWAGEVKKTKGDYFLAVDANLASLKTDPAVARSIHYQLREANNQWKAKATITYRHEGKFDWKTTRYRTYTRIYVPLDSQLIDSQGFLKLEKEGKKEKTAPASAAVSEELGKTVFGGFLSMEPGESKTLMVEYLLPESFGQQIQEGVYTLFVQKQLGAVAHQLTVDLNFGKKIKPSGESIFHQETDLEVDREFKIELAK